ncbi:glucosidase [Lithospermum erythrorhizon]|uniref:Glucosidase n=1 Tax=Lithospermum erythrorhizon TaxID=34254 RepID=A0AAV3REY4_LITER
MRIIFAIYAVLIVYQSLEAEGLAINLGTRSSHPLPADIVVKLLKDNGFNKVKLFEAQPDVLQALGKSGIQVMVGIPNDLLAPLASSVSAAVSWVQQNVSTFVSKYGTDIRYVAVGNEPFLKTYNNMFVQSTFPALKNIQAALIKAGLGQKVKATIPLNADVYEAINGLPSGGDFRADIKDLMVSIVKFVNDNGAPLMVNIYPFLSLYADANFPVDYAFFDGSAAPVMDGSITYTNVFEANYDTFVSTLEKNGFPNVEIIVGEVGWPTDGDPNANLQYARKFNQGLLDRIIQGKGTPKRPSPPDIYLFALTDEDAKSIEPGKFERHWGLFYFDGVVKYPLGLGNGRNITGAKGVKYLERKWCVMKPEGGLSDVALPQDINNACSYADCTSLGYGSSCGALDARSNASYAFNMYYQTMDQRKGSCEQFHNLTIVTSIDPSPGQGSACRFEIMIDVGKHEQRRRSSSAGKRSYCNCFFGHVLILLALMTFGTF